MSEDPASSSSRRDPELVQLTARLLDHPSIRSYLFSTALVALSARAPPPTRLTSSHVLLLSLSIDYTHRPDPITALSLLSATIVPFDEIDAIFGSLAEHTKKLREAEDEGEHLVGVVAHVAKGLPADWPDFTPACGWIRHLPVEVLPEEAEMGEMDWEEKLVARMEGLKGVYQDLRVARLQTDRSPGWGSCSHCKKAILPPTKIMTCGNCRLVMYDSVECQHAAWKLHRPFCKSSADLELASSSDAPPSQPLLPSSSALSIFYDCLLPDLHSSAYTFFNLFAATPLLSSSLLLLTVRPNGSNLIHDPSLSYNLVSATVMSYADFDRDCSAPASASAAGGGEEKEPMSKGLIEQQQRATAYAEGRQVGIVLIRCEASGLMLVRTLRVEKDAFGADGEEWKRVPALGVVRNVDSEQGMVGWKETLLRRSRLSQVRRKTATGGMMTSREFDRWCSSGI